MIDIFTALLGIVSICALVEVVTRIILSPPKVWAEEDSVSEEIEGLSDYKKSAKRTRIFGSINHAPN